MAKILTAEQTIAIEWLAKPKKGGKTFEEIAEICGVHPNTIGNWRKDKTFDAELKRTIVRENSDKLPELVASLTDLAIRGDGNAAFAKLALQVNGMLTDKLEVETNGNGDTDIDALRAKLAAYKERNKEA
ncbi:hypothetical protein LOZ80_15000 [Paenibacillus sp. HWE-109]|uniref:phBC6A51 family helix-turn-helix protein n=1 Tax=Paenibacillus sp. HWE-109 TaxID=1306526 RepID=UPI001EDFCFC3|nr:phBC6A51 family helix-turn-helix protein [Paenibacillus sp. HWE-109]UKS30169.1 hypothetical protein LOZ80_15000 [Paenibacillus sp. HWE-109]